jgi:hypothetical protein
MGTRVVLRGRIDASFLASPDDLIDLAARPY